MNEIGYIKLPLLKEGHFALIPYDKAERKMLGEDDFRDLLDKKILARRDESLELNKMQDVDEQGEE